ncbi:MAG: DUF6804 family protein [Saprospiraceae bacterium]
MYTTTIAIKITLIVLFLICLTDMPYGYFQLVRFLGMIGFGILAIHASSRKDNLFFIIWLASTILINPIIKISLGRTIWNVVDVVWAVLLLASIMIEPSHGNKEKTD